MLGEILGLLFYRCSRRNNHRHTCVDRFRSIRRSFLSFPGGIQVQHLSFRHGKTGRHQEESR